MPLRQRGSSTGRSGGAPAIPTAQARSIAHPPARSRSTAWPHVARGRGLQETPCCPGLQRGQSVTPGLPRASEAGLAQMQSWPSQPRGRGKGPPRRSLGLQARERPPLPASLSGYDSRTPPGLPAGPGRNIARRRSGPAVWGR